MSIGPLKVPFFSQLDNASGEGWRECFSSSCAMVAAYWGKVSSDDEYNRIRARYGDTTDAQAQLRALRSLGLEADFHTDGHQGSLERELELGRPVPVGWLHHGSPQNPTGGGHWSVVIGQEGEGAGAAWIINDPNGEADLLAGTYTHNTNGWGKRYSIRNWEPRWDVAGMGGWYLSVRPAYQAKPADVA